MKTLIITAHPHSKGMTHEIARSYKEGKESIGNTVEILDLYKTDLQQPYLTFSDTPPGFMADPNRPLIQAKMAESDEMVFVFPLWWVSAPAIMKNFLDNNLTSHFAYAMAHGKPQGLLKPRKARLYITCDGLFWMYFLIGFPFLTIWLFGILNYCGLRVMSVNVFYRKFKSTPEDQQKFFAKVKKQAIRGKQQFIPWLFGVFYKIYLAI